MDRNERGTTSEERTRLAFEALQSGLYTALPGIVQSFNPANVTCVIQPAIQGVKRSEQGIISHFNLPLLLDVPVMFFSGGGITVTLPLAAGDEGVVLFSSRCIDAWWQLGGVQPPMELRMHDMSDGFFYPGVFSQSRPLPDISTTAAQIRTDDGRTFVEIKDSSVKVHAGSVYEWDVNGYGQKITWTGGTNWTIDNYTTGATVTTNTHPISPPGPP